MFDRTFRDIFLADTHISLSFPSRGYPQISAGISDLRCSTHVQCIPHFEKPNFFRSSACQIQKHKHAKSVFLRSQCLLSQRFFCPFLFCFYRQILCECKIKHVFSIRLTHASFLQSDIDISNVDSLCCVVFGCALNLIMLTPAPLLQDKDVHRNGISVAASYGEGTRLSEVQHLTSRRTTGLTESQGPN